MKVILADDHRIMREGLRAILEKDPAISIVGECEDGNEALEMVERLKPDIVLMDVSMPGLNGIEATRSIVEQACPPKVVALSMHADRRFVREMLRAGASS